MGTAPFAATPRIADASVLLVDDDPDIRGMLQAYLAQLVSVTYTACTGSEALALLRERTIDILIADLVLPDINGFSLARTALEIRPALKILYMSGYAEATRHSSSRSRPVHFLAKPYRFDDVVRALHEVVAA